MAQRFIEPIARIFTNAGAVATGYKYYFYQTGTTTPVTTYQNTGLTVANTNPVISDSNGRFPEIWYSDLSQLKLVVKDSSNNTLETVDPVGASSAAASLNDFDVRPTSYWGLTAGTSTAYTLVANPTISAYANTQTFVIQIHTDCGANPTLAIDGLSALNLKKYTQQGTKVALKANDLRASQRYFCINDGVDIIVLNPSVLPILAGSATALTIASGAVTLTNNSSSYVADTESAAATDDLDTINGGQDGQLLFIRSAANARNVVIKHNTGNIYNPAGVNITLDLTTDLIVLRYDSTAVKWIIVAHSTAGTSPMTLISTATASSSSSISFTNLSSQYSKYIVEFSYIVAASANAGLCCQVSTDNGSSYANSNYRSIGYADSDTDAGTDYNNNATRFTLNVGFDTNSDIDVTTDSNHGLCGKFTIHNPASTKYKICSWEVNFKENASTDMWRAEGGGAYEGSTTAINAIRFIMKQSNSDTNQGNIASGTFKLYGVV